MPQQQVDKLLKAFDKAIKNKEKGKFGKDDINEIYEAANEAFDFQYDLSQDQIDKIRDKWVTLAEEKIDKSGATKKLQGTSRAEAIRSVLQSML
jgi:hypothetical protein